MSACSFNTENKRNRETPITHNRTGKGTPFHSSTESSQIGHLVKSVGAQSV